MTSESSGVSLNKGDEHPPSIVHKRVSATDLGTITYISDTSEHTSLSDLLNSIEVISSQLSGKGELEQIEILRRIRKKIQLFREQPPLSPAVKRVKHTDQSTERLATVLLKTKKNILECASTSETVRESLRATRRIISRLQDEYIQKPSVPTESKKRLPEATSEENSVDFYECLRFVEMRSSELKSMTEDQQKERFREIEARLVELESIGSRAFKKTKLDPQKLKQIFHILDNIKKNVAFSNNTEVLALLDRATHRFAYDIVSMTRQILNDASKSTSPLEALQKDFPLLQSFYGSDVRFRPFLRDMEKLLRFFRNRPVDEVRAFCIPLVRNTLLSDLPGEMLSPLEGHQIVAQALFVLDRSPDQFASIITSGFSVCRTTLKHRATALSTESFVATREVHMLPESLGRRCGFSEMKSVFVPLGMAQQLVLSDGSLNMGFVSVAKDTLHKESSSWEKKDPAFWQHISTVLHHLQSDEETMAALEAMPTPKEGSVGMRTVTATLLKDSTAPVSAQDVHCVALASLLTWLRQKNLGLCFMYSFQQQSIDASLRSVVDDFGELLSNDGVLRRTVNGLESGFIGLEIPEPILLNLQISKDTLLELYSCPFFQNACTKVGCTSQQELVYAIPIGKQSFSIEEVFENLRKKHQLESDSVRQAAWIAEAPGQTLLLTLWTNAMVSLAFFPVISRNIQEISVDSEMVRMLYAIAKSFYVMADHLGLGMFKQEMNDIWRQLRYVIHSKQFDPSQLVAKGFLPTDNKKIQRCLAPFAELRAFMVPVSPDKQHHSWIMYREQGGRLQPFHTDEEFEEFLQTKFFECCSIIDPAYVNTSTLKAISSKKFLPLFFSEYMNLTNLRTVGNRDTSRPLLNELVHSEGKGGITGFSVLEGRSSIAFTHMDKYPCEVNFGEKILEKVQQLRAVYGTSKELTVVVTTTDHAFRFLPNDPSLCTDNAKEKITFITNRLHSLLSSQRSLSSFRVQPERTPSAALQRIIEKAVQELQLPQEQLQQPRSNSWIRNIVQRVLFSQPSSLSRQESPVDTRQESLGNTIQKFLLLFAKNYKYYRTVECPKNILDLLFLQILADELGSDAERVFPRFADTNYVTLSGDPIYYNICLNPLSDSWIVVQTLRDPTREHPFIIKQVEDGFASDFRILNEIHFFAREAQRKDLLDMDRVVSKRLSELKSAFIICWEEFLKSQLEDSDVEQIVKEGSTKGTKLPQFEEKDLSSILQQGKKVASEDMHGQRAADIFHQCCTLRSMYQGILRKYLESGPMEEYRYTVFLEKEESSKYLTSDDLFFQAVHSRLVPTTIDKP